MIPGPSASRKDLKMLEMPNPTDPGPEPHPPAYPNPEPSSPVPEREPDWEPGENRPPGPVIDPMPEPVKMERAVSR